jgi:hypothetical protein
VHLQNARCDNKNKEKALLIYTRSKIAAVGNTVYKIKIFRLRLYKLSECINKLVGKG